MATAIEYALMAGASYIDNRNLINRFPTPQSWASFNHQSRDSGFEAVSFQSATNPNDIVISFAGTDPLSPADIEADIGLATGVGSVQLLQAADYYLQVKAANASNPDVNITFTGHSLGGGLAALMGVFFGKQAFTFDQAPFAKTAAQGLLGSASYALDLKNYLLGNSYTDPAVAAARDAAVSDLSTYLQLQQANGGIPNSNLVTDINVQGEFLSCAPATLFNRIGTQANIPDSASGVSGTDLNGTYLRLNRMK